MHTTDRTAAVNANVCQTELSELKISQWFFKILAVNSVMKSIEVNFELLLFKFSYKIIASYTNTQTNNRNGD